MLKKMVLMLTQRQQIKENPKGSLKREKRVGRSFPTNGGTQPATTLKENQIKFKVVKNEK